MVTGVLLAVYAGVVTSLTQLVPESGSTGAPDSWAVALATLAAAALFRPVLGGRAAWWRADSIASSLMPSSSSRASPFGCGMGLRRTGP